VDLIDYLFRVGNESWLAKTRVLKKKNPSGFIVKVLLGGFIGLIPSVCYFVNC